MSKFAPFSSPEFSNFCHSRTVAIAAGAVFGGLFVLVLGIFFVVFLYPRRKWPRCIAWIDRRPKPYFDERLGRVTFGIPPTHHSPYVSTLPQLSRTSFLDSESNYSQTNSFQHLQTSIPTHPAPANFSSSSDTETPPFIATNSDSRTPSSSSHTYAMEPAVQIDVHSVESPSTPVTPTSSRGLTKEQIIVIDNLRRSNVPPAGIAHLIEVMKKGNMGLSTGVS